MDPNTCLDRIFAFMADEDCEAALESVEDLLVWLNRGGFKPRLAAERAQQLQDEWCGNNTRIRQLVDALCKP